MSKSLDPDQARHFVGPDLGPNCLQILSTDDTSRQRVSAGVVLERRNRERSGSVVEYLTRDRRAAGLSLTGVTVSWSLSKTHLS